MTKAMNTSGSHQEIEKRAYGARAMLPPETPEYRSTILTVASTKPSEMAHKRGREEQC